jgi:hypothetical protein
MKFIEYNVKVFKNGDKEWYLNGKLHREDGPAAEWADGNKFWCLNGNLHRKDGPAIEYADGTKAWYINGNCHRENGPAYEYADGTKEYYLDGIKYSEKEFLAKTSVKELVSCAGKVLEFEGKKYKLVEV